MKHTLVFHLIGLSKKFQRVVGLKSQSTPLSYSQAAALLTVNSLNKVSQIDIAKRLHLQPASVVSLVDDLEKLQLVERRIQPENRRAYQIQLTDPGKAQIAKIRKQALLVEKYIKRQLTAAEYNSFFSIIDKLAAGLERQQFPASQTQKNGKGVKNELPITKRYVAS